MPSDDPGKASPPNFKNDHGDVLFDAATAAEARLHEEAQAHRLDPPAPGIWGTRDVTAEFVSATEQLPSGELVKDEAFTLFEAVGALEIMDPKMDSGYVPPGDTFESDFDVCGDLQPDQVLWIMDELTRLEMTFHDGYPLSQNIFTSLHVFRLIHPDNKTPYHFRFEGDPSKSRLELQQLVHIVLRAYCIATIKCVEVVLQTVQSQMFYEEEDFVTHLFGRELLPKLEQSTAQELLVDAMDWVDASSLKEDLKFGLKFRLVMREHVLFSMSGFHDQWSKLRDKFLTVTNNQLHELAKPTPEAFSNKVTRQLATSAPPRPMPDVSWAESCSRWVRLCNDMEAVGHATSHEVRHQPHCLFRAVWWFAYREPHPNTYARARLQEELTLNGAVAGEVDHYELIIRDIGRLSLAGHMATDPRIFEIEATADLRHQIARIMDDFIPRAFGHYIDLFRMICQNRSRMRRTLAQAVSIWNEMEVEAHFTDEAMAQVLRFAPKQELSGSNADDSLSQWVSFHKTRIMIWIIQLGFETDLYLPEELSNMYMLLCIIFEDHLSALYYSARVNDQRRTIKATHRKDYSSCVVADAFITSTVLKANAEQYLCKSLLLLFLLLEITGIIRRSSKILEDDRLRYEARIKNLVVGGNHAIPTLDQLYVKKLRQGNAPKTVGEFCKESNSAACEAIEDFKKLKSFTAKEAQFIGTELEWHKNIKALERVAVAAKVAVSTFEGVARTLGKLDERAEDHGGQFKNAIDVTFPGPGKRYHDWWVVPQIKEREK